MYSYELFVAFMAHIHGNSMIIERWKNKCFSKACCVIFEESKNKTKKTLKNDV